MEDKQKLFNSLEKKYEERKSLAEYEGGREVKINHFLP